MLILTVVLFIFLAFISFIAIALICSSTLAILRLDDDLPKWLYRLADITIIMIGILLYVWIAFMLVEMIF